ncbi:MAG TPA: DUF4352 domain-containing protein [Bryobacteraceae bacterium]|nr:DUF4352 domain-containing protein [Bryobacteraceae bacterium]
MVRPVLISVSLAFLLAGCGRQGKQPELTANMGESVRVGNLSYLVSEAGWMDQMGDGAAAKVPKNRFLTVRLSITNGGVRRAIIPATEVLDSAGNSYPEVPQAPGVDDWLGGFRALDPASTDHGLLIFDVPVGAYRLRVSDAADIEEQRTAYILLPYQTPVLIPRPDRAIPGSN